MPTCRHQGPATRHPANDTMVAERFIRRKIQKTQRMQAYTPNKLKRRISRMRRTDTYARLVTCRQNLKTRIYLSV